MDHSDTEGGQPTKGFARLGLSSWRPSSGHDAVAISPGGDEECGRSGQKAFDLFLPLYLVLLAFFIVLTASGTYDRDKGGDAMRSVSGALTTFLPPVMRLGPEVYDAPRGRELQAARRVDAMLKAMGLVARSKVAWEGAIIMSGTPEALFRKNDVRLHPERRETLSALAELLTDIPDAEVTFLLGDGDELALRRAAQLDESWALMAPFVPAEIGLLPESEDLFVRIDLPRLN